MATYTPVDPSTPSAERTTVITAVAAGDQINIVEILGRRARGLIVVADANTDVVDYRLNNRRMLRKRILKNYEPNLAVQAWGGHGDEYTQVEYWDHSDKFPVFSSTGSSFQLQSELQISSIEIDDLTGPATVEIVVW